MKYALMMGAAVAVFLWVGLGLVLVSMVWTDMAGHYSTSAALVGNCTEARTWAIRAGRVPYDAERRCANLAPPRSAPI